MNEPQLTNQISIRHIIIYTICLFNNFTNELTSPLYPNKIVFKQKLDICFRLIYLM